MNDNHCEIIAGYPIATQGTDSCVEQIVCWIKAGDIGRYFVCANPHSFELARKDKVFREAIRNAHLVTPDGIGIVIASKIHKGSIRGRVTGSDIFLGLSRTLNQEGGYRYFFLGSTKETLSLIKTRMKVEFPDIEVAGTYSPPFKTEFTFFDSEYEIKCRVFKDNQGICSGSFNSYFPTINNLDKGVYLATATIFSEHDINPENNEAQCLFIVIP